MKPEKMEKGEHRLGYPCNKHILILKALNMVDELTSLANNADALRDDTSCGMRFPAI